VNRKPLQLALREMHAVTTSRYARISLLLATIVLGVSGPFGTFQSFNLGQRFAYWGVMVVAAYITGQGAGTFFIELLRERVSSKWPRVILGGLLAGLPVAAVVLVVNAVAYQHFDAAEALQIWLYAELITLVVTLALAAIADVMRGAPAAVPAPAAAVEAAPAAPAPPPILERVPLPQRGALLALSVEDHYVDIVTERGKTLVLMRLADAIPETGDVPGLQIHRSHWVATSAVVKAHRSEGKVTLELSNGMRLPVSRGYLPAVREAGLV
jgi:DNA-binding LytR/AlgR family response regulator